MFKHKLKSILIVSISIKILARFHNGFAEENENPPEVRIKHGRLQETFDDKN